MLFIIIDNKIKKDVIRFLPAALMPSTTSYIIDSEVMIRFVDFFKKTITIFLKKGCCV
jgi:hypothetical protein